MVALLAIPIFSSLLAAGPAAAENTLLAEWLLNNASLMDLTSVQTGSSGEEGKILFEDSKTPAGAAAVLCRVVFVGSVGPNGEDEIDEILGNLSRKISETLGSGALLGTGASTGEGAECITVSACAEGSSASPIELVLLGLPWHTLLFLDELSGLFLDLILTEGELGYEMLCLVLLVNAVDKCTAAGKDVEIEVINDLEDAAFPVNAVWTPKLLCSQSKEEVGLTRWDALTFIMPLALLLSVSSEL